jgi:MFS family permease
MLTFYRFIPNSFGRRRLFIISSLGMGACMLISGLTIMAGGHNNGIGTVVALYMFQVCIQTYLPWKSIPFTNLHLQAFFTWGWMSNMWAYPSEILPIRLRQTGGALSVVWQWLITFLVVEITPVGIQNIGWKLYLVFCILNWATILVVYFWYPETAGKTLEQIDFLFASQSSLREVVKLSIRKDFDELAIIRETQAQAHHQKVEKNQVEDVDEEEEHAE